MHAAGHKVKRCFSEMVDRLRKAQLLECRGSEGFALTQVGRNALYATRPTHLQPRRRGGLPQTEHRILTRLATATAALRPAEVRDRLRLRSDLTYGSIEQLVVAGH